MYRKRSGSGYSKRRTNIYDPQGVYKKGLTKKQKTGMSNQVKLQYLEMPKPRITRQLLDEYKKTLIFYGIPTVSTFNPRYIEIPITMEAGTSVFRDIFHSYINSALETMGIQCLGYLCNSFAVKRDSSAPFPSYFKYTLHYYNYTGAGTTGGSFPITGQTEYFSIGAPVKEDESNAICQYPYGNAQTNDIDIKMSNDSLVAGDKPVSDQMSPGETIPFFQYPPRPFVNVSGSHYLNFQYTSTTDFDVIIQLNIF